MNFVITIATAVIAGLLLLYVEYGYLQRQRKGEREASDPLYKEMRESSADESAVADYLPASLSPSGDKAQISWPDAINSALRDFRKLHPNDYPRLVGTDASEDSAGLTIEVYDSIFETITHFHVMIEKDGKILSIKQSEPRRL